MSVEEGVYWPRPEWKLAVRNHAPNTTPEFSYRNFTNPAGSIPEVVVSTDRAHPEVLAKQLLAEAVIGFDMEWYYDTARGSDEPRGREATLKDKISVIQACSEAMIAIFHLARHDGETVQELLAPSLRKLIESPNIKKIGVAIMGDCERLHQFGLQPCALYELMYLDNVLNREKKTIYTSGGLEKLIRNHFHPLVMPKAKSLPTGYSNESGFHTTWSEALDEIHQHYAANDAYASLMLYWRMEQERLDMRPLAPPPLRNASDYMKANRLSPRGTLVRFIQFEPLLQKASVCLTTRTFETLFEGFQSWDAIRKPVKEGSQTISDLTDRKLFAELLRCRKRLADAYGVQPHVIAPKSALAKIATRKPLITREQLRLEGMNGMFLDEWMREIEKSRTSSKENIATLPPDSDPQGSLKHQRSLSVECSAPKKPKGEDVVAA